jgi:hypothetical protein
MGKSVGEVILCGNIGAEVEHKGGTMRARKTENFSVLRARQKPFTTPSSTPMGVPATHAGMD